MPKVSQTPFTYYTFRYDYQDDNDIEKIKSYILANIPKYAIFKEISSDVGKKHIQGKLGKALSLVQLRKQLKEAFPMFIKSNYSIADVKDVDKYDSYICKDGDVLCNNIFTEEYIKEQVEIHKQNVAVFDKKQKDRAETVTFTKSVANDFCKLFSSDVVVIQQGLREYKPSDYEKASYRKSCNVLLNYLLKRLGKIAKVFDDNVLQRMYSGIKNDVVTRDEVSCADNWKSYEFRIKL